MKRVAYRSSRLMRRLRKSKQQSFNDESKQTLNLVTKKTESVFNSSKLELATPVEPPLKQLAENPPLFNPFPMLAHATENIDLASRLRAYANNFGIIGALWCTLSISALTVAPIDDVYKETQRMEAEPNSKSPIINEPRVSVEHMRRRRTSINALPPDKRIRQPVLVKYFGIPEQYLEDIYMASWSASFFTSAIGLGLSTVVAGIVAATAPAYVKIFVRRHSDILMALPICQGLSSGFAAVGLTVGLDEARGEPVAWIGYIGSLLGATVVGGSTLRVLRGYKAFRASGKLNATPKEIGK